MQRSASLSHVSATGPKRRLPLLDTPTGRTGQGGRYLGGHGLSLVVDGSMGVVEIEPARLDFEAVMSAADAACYEARRAGRNTVRTHPRQKPGVVAEITP